jgi:drug/metabolite transporter (DMT)-like permease
MQRFPRTSFAAVIVVWAGAFAVIKALLDRGVGAEEIALARYIVAAPGFAFLLWRAGGLPGVRRGDAIRLAVTGLLVVVGYHVSLNVGERYTSSGIAALMVALAPALTLLFAVLFGVERFTARAALGLAVAFAGVFVVVTLGTGEELSFAGVKGPLIVLGAPISFALYNVLLKPLLGRYDLLALTAASSLVGTIGLLPFLRPSDLTGASAASWDEIGLVLYLGILATLLGYVAWNTGLRAFGATRAVSAAYVIPALAVLIGAVALEEPVTAWIAAGGLLIVLGVALTSSRGGVRGRGRPDVRLHGARRRAGAPSARAAEPPSRAR